MARVVIEIDGDASGAEAALGDVQGSLSDLDSASESAGGAVGGLNTKLVNSASAVGIAKMGLDLLVGGFNILGQSAESYFARTEEGQEMWADLGRQAGELKGALFELFIGTSDQAEAFEILSDALSVVVSVGRGAAAVLRPIGDLMRGSLSAGARALAVAFGDAGGATSQFSERLGTANSELDRLQRLLSEQYGEGFGVDRVVAVLDNLGTQNEHVRRAFESLAAEMGEATDQELRFLNSTRQLNTELSVIAAGMVRTGQVTEVVADAMLQYANTEQGRTDVLLMVNAVMEENGRIQTQLAAAAESSASATSSASSATEEQSISAEEAAISVARLAVETGNATLQVIEQKHALDLLNAALGEKADRDKIASESAVSQLEKKRALMEQESEFERAMLLKTEGLKEQLAEKEAARSARQKERVDLAKAGFQTLTNSAVSMAAASIKSGKKSAEETRKMIGDELVALGAAGLAQSAMMLFKPGEQALAVGLGVASVAAMALGSKLGATAISGGGGVAAPAADKSQSVTNVTFQNNFAQIGSRDQFLRVTGDAFQEAVDEGYIALPRGA